MKRFYKKLILLGTAVIMCASLTACGGKKEANTSAKDKKEFVYVPEYQAMTDQSDINNLVISNNIIYYTTWSYDEATQMSSSSIKSMEVGSTEGKTLPIEIGQNDNVSIMQADKDGNLVFVLYSYTEGENPEDYTQTYILKKYDKDGNEILNKDLTELMSGTDSMYVQYLTTDDEGNIYLSNGDSKIWVVDGSGNDLFNLDIDNYISTMGTTKEGKVVIATYDADKMVFREVDKTSKALGATYENIPNPYGSFTLVKGVEKGCLINSGNSLYEYDLETQTAKEILNWIDCDIDSDRIAAVSGLEDGRILALTRDYSGETTKSDMVYLSKKKASEVAEKTILTYGTLYMSSNVRSAIINFNKTNETYRIQPKEYGTDDYTAGIAQLNSDIVSGNTPDIIDLSNGSVNKYIEKGILEDLYPFFDKDSDMKKENYVESAFKAYERDGKLYAAVPSFAINTIIGRTSDVGSEMGWTMDELIALVKSKPEGTEVFSYATKESILSSLCTYGLADFVDWSTGKCSFDSDEFIKMLEFSNTFSSESEYVYDESAPSMPTKIRNGQLLFMMTNISDVQSYQMYEAMYGEPITFIGYPTSEGTGSSIMAGEVLLGISSKSKNKDGAWEFVRTFLTPEYQASGNLWSFPVLKTALEDKFKEAMEPEYYEDETGKQVHTMKTSWGYDDANFDIYEATQEQVDAVKNLIQNADSVYEYNDEMYSIISEEAAAFFAGQKTAQDVANIIQSRVQIYVNENR
jgi:ABC-type glycerol-3-phosphate transport system substrate-binding protein